MKVLNDEIMEVDALNRIKWDDRLDSSEYTIHYKDRFNEDLSMVSFDDVEIINVGLIRIMSFYNSKNIKYVKVPLHRIRQIKRNNKLVWVRESVKNKRTG